MTVHPHAPDPYVLREQADEHYDHLRQWAFGAESSPANPPSAGVATGTAGGVNPSASSAVPPVSLEAGLAWLHGLADVLPLPLAAKCRYLALDLAREARLQS